MVFVVRGRITARIMIHFHSLRSQSHLASRLVNRRVPARVLVNQGMASLLAVLAATANSIAVKRHVIPISVPV